FLLCRFQAKYSHLSFPFDSHSFIWRLLMSPNRDPRPMLRSFMLAGIAALSTLPAMAPAAAASAAAASAAAAPVAAAPAGEVSLYTTREPKLIQPLLDEFTK